MEFVRKVTNDIYFKHFLLRYNFQELAQKNNLVCETDLIFVTNHIPGEKIVMWRNFSLPCMTIVGKLKISPQVEKVSISPQLTWKAEISPHDNFFSTNNMRDISDKYQVCFQKELSFQ